MKRVIASAGLIALGAVSVHTARADWAAGADKPWSVSGTLRGFYDDNYNTEPNGPNKRDSFGFEVSPQAAINYSTGPTTLKASYAYSLKYYDDRQGNKVDQSHDIELSMYHAFNERYKMDVEESFLVGQEPQVLQGGTPLRANGDNIANTFAVNFNGQITELLGFLVGYANSVYDFTGDLPPGVIGAPYSTSLNRVEQTVTLNSRWTITSQTTGVLGYSFQAVNYIGGGNLNGPNAPIYLPSTSRNNYTHDIYLGLDHTFRSDFSVSGRAGVQVSDYYNAPAGNSANDLGPFASLSLNYNYTDGGVLTLGFRQAKNQTDIVGGNGTIPTQDQESSTVYGSIVQTLTPLSPKLTATLTAQYQNSVYNGGSVNEETDTFYLFGVNFAYQFTHYISGEVGYNYDLLSSDIFNRGYDRNRVYVGVTASY